MTLADSDPRSNAASSSSAPPVSFPSSSLARDPRSASDPSRDVRRRESSLDDNALPNRVRDYASARQPNEQPQQQRPSSTSGIPSLNNRNQVPTDAVLRDAHRHPTTRSGPCMNPDQIHPSASTSVFSSSKLTSASASSSASSRSSAPDHVSSAGRDFASSDHQFHESVHAAAPPPSASSHHIGRSESACPDLTSAFPSSSPLSRTFHTSNGPDSPFSSYSITIDEKQVNDQTDTHPHSHSHSTSFLSQLQNESRTPTARYSFDDHQDYFHRLEWEALVEQEKQHRLQQQQQQQPQEAENPGYEQVETSKMLPRRSLTDPDAVLAARSDTPSSYSSSNATVQPSHSNVQTSRPPAIPYPHAATSGAYRQRSNSHDGTSPRGSFRDGRYTTRPRHAHPGPPPPGAVFNMRSPQPWLYRVPDQKALNRPRSNSRNDNTYGWSNRPNLAVFADTGIPGTSFPHPGLPLGASGPETDVSPREAAADFENRIQPWDSPRLIRRSITLASAEGVRRSRADERPASIGAGISAQDSNSPQSQQSDHEGGDAEEENEGDDEASSKKSKRPLQKRLKDSIRQVKLSSNYFALYKFADRTDIILLCVGTIAAIGSGVPLPLIGILFGQLIDGFNNTSCSGSSQPSDPAAFISSVNDKVSKIAIIAAVNFFLIWTYTTCWSNLGERLVRKMRERYLKSVLRQDMAFFDKLKPGEVGTRLSADLLTIQNGTSEKMGIMISSLSYFVTSYIVSFIKLPVLAGQLVSLLPAFGLVSVIGSKFVAKAQKNTSTHLSHAASLAAEALNNLPIVQAFGSQKRLSNIYQSHLELARKQGTLKALSAACVLGMLFFVGYSANALAFFSGSNLISSSGNGSTVGSVYTVIFLLLDASFIIGQIAPYLQTFSAASGAGQALRETINKVSPIDGTDSTSGLTPQPGDVSSISIEFDNVEFTYPARPDEKALHGLRIDVPAGHRVALVGMSGSGKSTVAALAQRFYDPTSGTVKMNGIDLKDYNVRWLRSQIGVVGQEPVLFDCSIMQSIAHGLVGSPAHEHLRETVLTYSQVGQEKEGTEVEQLLNEDQREKLEEIKQLCIEAAKMAGAHKFIEKLPQGYDSQVGESGGKLSGGQKQRISIARAIVKQPKLLILDEATAALDSHSERVVGDALDSISDGVTTIAIAHRLATIRNYDKIVVMGAGKVLEEGTHKDLLAKRGYYYKLAEAQDTGSSEKADVEDAEQEERGDSVDSSNSSPASSGDSTPTLASTRDGKGKQARMADVVEGDEEQDQSAETTPAASRRSSSQMTLARRSSAEDVPRKKNANRDGERDNSDKGQDGLGAGAEVKETEQLLDETPTRYPARVILKRILWLVRREWGYILIGLFTSTVMGGSYSGEAVLFGHVIEALNPQCRGADGVRSSGRTFALYFFILALIQLCAYSLNGLVWGMVAERLLFRLRRVSFNTMMDQRLTWYEKQDQNPASMIASLSNDANNLGGLTGTVIGTIFCIFVNLAAGIIVSHAIAWRIAVVILALVPIILAAGYLRLKVLADFQKRHETAYVKSNALAIEAVQCIKTVASLGREEDVMRKFDRSLQKPYRETLRHFLFGNIFLALALSISYFIYAFAYWWGSQNIAEGRYSQTAFFIVLPALLFSAQASGQLLAFAPDFSKAHVSAANFFRLMDQRPQVVERKARHQQTKRKRGGRTKDDSRVEDAEKRSHTGLSAAAKKSRTQKGTSVLKKAFLCGGSDRKASIFSRQSQGSKSLSEKRGSGVREVVGDIEADPSLRHADDVEPAGPSQIEFSDVWFTYPSRSDPALRGVSLTIAAGSFAAFVGQSGSGKTTAMSLIENFYTPSSGHVTVDGKRTDKTPDQLLRKDIAIVPQEPVIFYGTVRFNVLLGLRPDLTKRPSTSVQGEEDEEEEGQEEEEDLLAPYREDLSWQNSVSVEEIEDACRQAGIHETIMGFKKGYETLISSSQLSGGQKQRLSIARALIRKPRLLLLDESTSALDSQSEQAFQKTIEDIRKSKTCTILAIAHRMRTIRDSDQIFLFENGQVEASGRYADLIKSNAKFKAMVSYQSLN